MSALRHTSYCCVDRYIKSCGGGDSPHVIYALILVKLHTAFFWSRMPANHHDATTRIEPSGKAASAAPNKGPNMISYYIGGLLLAQADKTDPGPLLGFTYYFATDCIWVGRKGVRHAVP